jgi:hypothetical protein
MTESADRRHIEEVFDMNTETQAVALTVPLLPGTTDTDRRVMTSFWHGDRQADHEAARRRLGVTRESVWIQPTPDGDVVVVLFEARDIEAALDGISTSQEPFDIMFRDHCRDVHGIDLEAGFPPPEMVLDFRG